MVSPRRVTPDPFFPLVRRSEGTAGPSNKGRTQAAQSLQQIRPQHTVATHVSSHHRDEVEQHRTISRRNNLHRGLCVPHRTCERKRNLYPLRSLNCKRYRSNRLSLRPLNPKRQLGRSLLPLHPNRAVVLDSGLQKNSPLPNPCTSTRRMQTHALLAVLKINLRNLNSAVPRRRLPVRLEVLSLKPRAADLF